MNNNDFAWIAVPDIVPLFNLSPNTEAQVIKPYIIEAQHFDLLNVIPETLYNALNIAIQENPTQWKINKTYQSGDKVFYSNRYYIANTTTTETPTNSTEWDDYELMNFYYSFVKKWLAGATMQRYLPYMGLHITQWGLEQYNQDGFGQVTDKRRGEISNAVKNKTDVYFDKMIKELNRVNYTFDSVVYAQQTCKETKTQLPFSIIGAGKYKNYGTNRDSERYRH
jgi:hypothetical protein